MTTNGFGYVAIEHGKIKVVSGEYKNEIVNYYDNDNIVSAVVIVDKLMGVDFRKEHDVEAVKKAILDDKKELREARDKLANIQTWIDGLNSLADSDDVDWHTSEILDILEPIMKSKLEFEKCLT